VSAAELELEVGPVAHGGFCVARHEGQAVFVRHALPGERVRAVVTERRKGFLRADAVEILLPSPDRVIPPCPFAGPGRCGGCDWQHASWEFQRELKARVLREQLARLGGLPDVAVSVEPLPGGQAGRLSIRDNHVGQPVAGQQVHIGRDPLLGEQATLIGVGDALTGSGDEERHRRRVLRHRQVGRQPGALVRRC